MGQDRQQLAIECVSRLFASDHGIGKLFGILSAGRRNPTQFSGLVQRAAVRECEAMRGRKESAPISLRGVIIVSRRQGADSDMCCESACYRLRRLNVGHAIKGGRKDAKSKKEGQVGRRGSRREEGMEGERGNGEKGK